MTKKWNLQDIRPAQPRKSRVMEPTEFSNATIPRETPLLEREHIPSIVIEDGTKKGSNRLIISVVLFFIIVGGAIGLSALMGKTELTIYPQHRQPNVSAEFTAYPDKRDDSLSFEIMTLETTGEAQVKATGQVDVEQQATGVIEIIKTTPGAERLVKNTRFKSSSGQIFKIQESVIVPGAMTGTDGGSVPGTIQAEVFADEAGEQYNLAAGQTFTVPGFEEGGFMDLYKAITARNGEAFTGGFKGPQFQIDKGESDTARQALQIKLRDELLAQIETKKPANFVLFNEAVAITYNQLPTVEYGNELVTLKEQAILQIPMFEAIEFGSFLAKQTVPTYDGTPVRVENPEEISFQYTSATTSASVIANEPSLTFRLSGKPHLIWKYDEAELTKQLAGLSKTTINNAIDAHPGIESASVRITPFWKRNFPEDPTEIIIIEKLDKTEETKKSE